MAPSSPTTSRSWSDKSETHRNTQKHLQHMRLNQPELLQIENSLLFLTVKMEKQNYFSLLQIMFSKCLINTMFMVIVALKCCWCYHETKILSQGVRGIIRDEGKAEEGKKREEESHEKHMTWCSWLHRQKKKKRGNKNNKLQTEQLLIRLHRQCKAILR